MMRGLTLDIDGRLKQSVAGHDFRRGSVVSGISGRGLTVKRFQRIVCHQIIGCDVEDVRNHDRMLPTLAQILDLREFKQIMETLLPAGEIGSLGAKYIQVAMNFFRNDYLRDVIQ